MLRFTSIPKDYTKKDEKGLVLDENIWEKSRKLFLNSKLDSLYSVPVFDEDGNLTCLGIEDEVADLYLRMVSELLYGKFPLGFKEVYPQYDGVCISGFNELALNFALYLKNQGIPFSVDGNYWKHFIEGDDISDIEYTKVLHISADGSGDDIYEYDQALTTTVAFEFECIEKIYRANEEKGYICDLKEPDIIKKLRKNAKIVILGAEGNSIEGLKLYDYLVSKDIDIIGFIDPDSSWRGGRCVGKAVYDIDAFVKMYPDAIILDPDGMDLGIRWVNLFSRFGYIKNQNYIVTRDVILCDKSLLENLVKKHNIVLVGDADLCNMVKCFMTDKCCVPLESINIYEYDSLLNNRDSVELLEDSLVFTLFFSLRGFNPKSYNTWSDSVRLVHEDLKELDIKDYSNFYSYHSIMTYVAMTLSDRGMPAIKNAPGIKVATIQPHGGHLFFRGILDGHPKIMALDFTSISDELFYACCKLVYGKYQDVADFYIKNYSKSLEWLGIDEGLLKEKCGEVMKRVTKKDLSPQDYAVIIHIIFNEINRPGFDYKDAIIYWEPHHWTRNYMDDLRKWLELGGYDAQNIVMTRSAVSRYGSIIRWRKNNENLSDLEFFSFLHSKCIGNENVLKKDKNTFVISFEETKVNPNKALKELFDFWDIPWDDSLLEVTEHGKGFGFDTGAGVTYGFDLKPVINNSSEVLSEINRMIIGMVNYKWQNYYGYECQDPRDYSGRELLELSKKEFPCFTERPITISIDDYIKVKRKRIREVMFRLWFIKNKAK